jgi:hypothetical protein
MLDFKYTSLAVPVSRSETRSLLEAAFIGAAPIPEVTPA